MREESPFVVYNSPRSQAILDKRAKQKAELDERLAREAQLERQIGVRSSSRFDPQSGLTKRPEIEAEIARLQRILEREGM